MCFRSLCFACCVSRICLCVSRQVEHTGARMRVAQGRLKKLIRKSNECKMTCLLFWVVVVLFAVLLIVLRVTSSGIFG